MLMFAVIFWMFTDPAERVFRGSAEYLETLELWQGNYGYQTLINAGISIGLVILSPLFILWQTLGLMVLGVYLYRTDFFTQGFSASTFNKIMASAVISTLLCIAPQLLIEDIDTDIIPLISSISAIFVGLVYAHIIVKLCHAGGGLSKAIANTGKVAFSLYILQSVVMAILLRWLWPEFSETATHFDYFILVLSYTLIQILVANLYLLKFEQGPFEQLWRALYSRTVDKKLKKLAVSTESEFAG